MRLQSYQVALRSALVVACLLVGALLVAPPLARAESGAFRQESSRVKISWVRKVDGEIVGLWTGKHHPGVTRLELDPYEVVLWIGGIGERPEFQNGIRYYHASFWDLGEIWVRATDSTEGTQEMWEFTAGSKTVIDTHGQYPNLWYDYTVWMEVDGKLGYWSKLSLRPGWYELTGCEGRRILLATPEPTWEEAPSLLDDVSWIYVVLPDGSRMYAECREVDEMWWLEGSDGQKSGRGLVDRYVF